MSKGPELNETEMRRPGMGLNGGVWAFLNQTLIWALALVNGEMAWEEWKKNSFARHADVYPDVWYSTWSGPDTINSTLGKQPGKVFSFWLDCPVFNMHSHACPLYSVTKLMAIEFTERGVKLAPIVPVDSYRFDSPLIGLTKSHRGYEGWYAPPAAAGSWTISLRLPSNEAPGLNQVEVNGARTTISRAENGVIEIKGDSRPGSPLRWAVRRI